VLRARLTAQLLAGEPARDPVAVAERLLAIQGQDPRGARLAVRARSKGLSAADVDRALTEERSLLITWLNRGTLHLVRSEDYAWLQALTTPQLFTQSSRRLAQEGVPPDDAERAIAEVERSLAANGPLNRDQLRERIDAIGVRTERQAMIHVLFAAALRGRIVRGPMVEGKHAYVLVRDWLGEQPEPVDRDAALVELARRYLAGHGPASDRDLARWAGLPLRDVRAGLKAIASEIVELPSAGVGSSAGAPAGSSPGAPLVDLAGRSPAADLPPPKLLGPFDPLLLGWTSREEILGPHQQLVTVNGVFRPFALVRGRAAASWSMPRGEVVIEPFGRLGAADAAALDNEARDVMRFFRSA
jgi:winged helix DNA-binding protein